MTKIDQPRRRHLPHAIYYLALLALLIVLAGDERTAVAQNQWTPNGNDIINANTGNVGIGTTEVTHGKITVRTPAGNVPGIARFEQSQGTNDRGGYISFGNSSTNNKGFIGFGKTGAGTPTLFAAELANSFGIRSEGALHLGANGANIHMTLNSGNVGVGTTAPGFKFDVQGGQVNASAGLCIAGDCKTSWAQVASQWTTSSSNIYFNTGNVGIGTLTPSEKLQVEGNVSVTGNMNATGTITGGNIVAKYQDLAEWVPSTQKLAAGTVVVLDPEKTNQILASTQPYDTRVAGVVSSQPGIALGEAGEGKLLVATTGRVKVKVDATRAPIRIGDLLVTSEATGMAMKSEPITVGSRQMHTPGTLLGKALEPLEKGVGEILVLLSLQ